MSLPTEPGATGRKARGASGAPEPAPSAPATETSAAALATAGTAETAAQAAEKPVVVGTAEVPLEPGGPGAGAARVAEVADAVASRPLAGMEPDTAPLTVGERAELEALRRQASRDPERAELAALRALSAAGGVVVDAARIGGTRIATATAQIKRDGVTYAIGAPVLLDFEGYTELVGIGAIVNAPWAELELVGEA